MRNYATPFTPYYSSTIICIDSNLSLHHIHHHHHRPASLSTSLSTPYPSSLQPFLSPSPPETKSLATFEKKSH